MSIEVERLSGMQKDGAEAVRAAMDSYREMVAGTTQRMMLSSMRSASEVFRHLSALTQARTFADVVRLQAEFLQRQMAAIQERFDEVIGLADQEKVRGPEAKAREKGEGRADGPAAAPVSVSANILRRGADGTSEGLGERA